MADGREREVVIIGSGPAGYTAAIYAARAALQPLVITGEINGGQLMNTTVVENWPGVKDGILGPDLMVEMRAQAEKFGAEMMDRFATAVDFSSRPFRVWTKMPEGKSAGEVMLQGSDEELANAVEQVKQMEHDYEAKAVILATGAAPIYLEVPGQKELLGRGVAACAVCDAAFYKDKVAYVIGGGDAAVEDTLALTKFAREVGMVVRRDSLRASKIMAERVTNNSKVKIMWNTELKEIVGSEKVEKIKVVNNQINEESEVVTDGVFFAIGHRPVTRNFRNEVVLDEKGYVVTRLGFSDQGVKLASENIGEDGLLRFPTMTSVEGVFAAGDNVDFRYRQAVTAAGMGCQAALDAERFLENRGGA